ncbi:MAG: DUF6340 family protein [Bacteroidota bacterium]
MKKTLLSLFILVALLSSCSKYGFVNLKYPNPPAMVLPENIKTIAIVNRSLTPKTEKNNKALEAITSGEIAGSDKIASDECLKGVYDRINGWGQMTIVIPAKTRLYGTGTRVTPEILDWKLVKNICDSNKADALLVLETFDSNSDLVAGAVVNTATALITGNQVKPSMPSQIRMNVLSFWRLYDPVNKKIIDQFQSNSQLVFDAGGAALNVPPPDALPKTAYNAGMLYIERFLPSYYFVHRDMYKRGKGGAKQMFKTAFRRAEVANWDGASELWTKLSNDRKRKNAGRACLNMAVACEVKGNIDMALVWAKKAYEDYRDKTARSYVNNLQYRKNIER